MWPATVTTPPTGTMQNVSSAGMSTRNGASLKTNRFAFVGTRSSLKKSLMPSASVWRIPNGPQRCGPIRLCMSPIALRSHQISSITETMSAANAAITLMATTKSSAQWTPPAYSGSPAARIVLTGTPS